MLSKKIESALNKQINHEISAAYNYLAMAGHFERGNLTGFSNWMLQQRNEELEHAMKLYQYLLDRGGKLELSAIPKPQGSFGSIRAVFQKALEQEKINTKAIHSLYSLAAKENDYTTQSQLQWFLDEQVEEEKIMDEVIALLDLAKGEKSAPLVLNQQLGERKGESTEGSRG